ncbi:MAG: hypothetical protein R3227_16070 [Reinekea sp.]|nr:hypothetical protein [Reinekea sp.]
MTNRKPYSQSLTARWWLRRPGYRRYMLREATSLLVGLFTVELWLALLALARGEASWTQFVETLQSPWMLAFNLVCWLAVLWHTVTWFQLTPKTLDLRWRGEAFAPSTIKTGHYVALAVISVVVVLILGGWL